MLILLQIKILPGTLLLAQLVHIIFPTTSLGTSATVAVATGQIAAQKTATAVGNAHSTVYEGFNFYLSLSADFGNLL